MRPIAVVNRIERLLVEGLRLGQLAKRILQPSTRLESTAAERPTKAVITRLRKNNAALRTFILSAVGGLRRYSWRTLLVGWPKILRMKNYVKWGGEKAGAHLA